MAEFQSKAEASAIEAMPLRMDIQSAREALHDKRRWGDKASVDDLKSGLTDGLTNQGATDPAELATHAGEVGASTPAVFGLADRDGVFEGSTDRLAWEYADDRANDEQQRDR